MWNEDCKKKTKFVDKGKYRSFPKGSTDFSGITGRQNEISCTIGANTEIVRYK